LKEQAKNIGGFEKEEKKEKLHHEPIAKMPAADEDEEEDYFSRQMRRIP